MSASSIRLDVALGVLIMFMGSYSPESARRLSPRARPMLLDLLRNSEELPLPICLGSFVSAMIVSLVDGCGESRVGSYYLPLGSRSEEHTSELQSLMRSSYAVF